MRDILQRGRLLWRRTKMKYLEQFHFLEIMIKLWDVCHKFWQKVILFWKVCDQFFSFFFLWLILLHHDDQAMPHVAQPHLLCKSLYFKVIIFENYYFQMLRQQCCQSLTFSASLLTKDSCWLKLLRRSLETFNTFWKFSIKWGPCLFTRFFCFAVFDYIGAR